MEIKIQLPTASLEANHLEGVQINEIVKGFFGVLNPVIKELKNINPVINITNNDPKKSTEIAKQVKDSIERIAATYIPPAEKVALIPKGETVVASKKLPFVNENRESIGTIGEVARIIEKEQPKEEEPEHWKTGIKVEEGVNKYRTYYWCDCGNKGKRYIPIETEQIHCHTCNELLWIDPATPDIGDNGLPLQDGFGNFYIAREMVNVAE